MRTKPVYEKITATGWQTRVYELKDEGRIY
jgi:hypothetical protein